MEVPGHSPATAADDGPAVEGEPVRVTKETLQAVLEQCRRALELLHDADLGLDPAAAAATATAAEVEDEDADGNLTLPPPPSDVDYETDELCDLLKSKVESSDFLEKLRRNNRSISCNTSDESASWDIVSATDLWEDKNVNGNDESDQDGYVLVRQEDIAEGIASFMAAYLLSLKQTKELTPNQLQEALSKTFSVKKKKSKIRKAWDGSKIVYNVASWGATAIGIYQNPAILKAASAAFWTSCQAISKLL